MNTQLRAGTSGKRDTLRKAIRARASLHLLGEEGVLLDPQAQRIYRLNPASTLLWCCLAEGWSETRIRELLVERLRLSPEGAANYLASTLAEWRNMGLLGDGRSQGTAGSESGVLSRLGADPSPPSTAHRGLGYRILDCGIELQGLPAPLADAMDEALGHLGSDRLGSAPIICTLVEAADGYILTEDDSIVDRCAAFEAVVPMVKAALIRIAIGRAAAFAVVHAAAVFRNGRAVILPGPAGSGKSTLAANLVLDGWALAADDTTIIGHDVPCHVRPLPTALTLKTEAWPVIAARAPELMHLTVHRRGDGKQVRYLRPRHEVAAKETESPFPIGLIAFPRYVEGVPLNVRRLDLREAFDRFLPEFYPVSNRFEAETMDRLVGFLRQVTAIELCYGDGAAAAEAILRRAQ